MNSLNKDIIPLFDPIDWELKVHNMNYLIKSKNKIMDFKDLKNNEKLKSFIKSIEDDLEDKKKIKLIKLNNESEKQKFEQEHKQNLEENISNKYKELQELLSNGTSKLVQKQNANKYLTDIIDRDENIKLACMNSLYQIYRSFLDYNMLESMVKLLSDSFENGLKEIEKLERINPNNQMKEYVFSYSHKIISNTAQINRLKEISANYFKGRSYFQINKFHNLYYDIIQLYKEIYNNNTNTIEVKDELFIRKIYLSFIQDFFIFYVKGSGALYLLFTNVSGHKLFVEPAYKLGDLFDITTNKDCFINKNDEKIELFDYFNSLNLGNSDWDLNLCINPGLYENLYDKFIVIYQFILNWNRRQMYICREKFFIKNQNITNSINDFFKQVNYDYISELSESMIENGNKLIQDDGTIIINQSEIGIAFIERSELDSTIYRIVSENDISNNEQLVVDQIGKSYNIPWLGSESNENDSDLLLEDIIMKKKTYQNVKNYIKEMFTETSSTSIKYAFNNNQLDNKQLHNKQFDIDDNPIDISFSNIGRTFYIQYNDSIDAFGLLRLSFLGVNTIKNKINNSTAGAGELLDISFIKDYTEMKSDWEHRDLLINDERLPLVDYWDIIMDLNITMRDNVLQGNLKKINKRLDRLRYLQSILCCKANIEKNITLLAAYYSGRGKRKCSNKNTSIDKNNCYWDDEKILLFLENDDRRMKKFGVLLTKLQQVEDNFFYYPYNSDIRNYIIQQFQKSTNIEPSEEEIYKNSIGFGKQKIEAINTSLRHNPKLNILSNRIQNKYKLTPYISNLISKLYIYCDKQLSKDQNEIKLSAKTLLTYFGPGKSSSIPAKKDYLEILGIYLMYLNKYKQGIDFLIDQIFLGNDNNTINKLNFRNFLNSIISSLDIITGNYFGFTWIIYKENILTNNSKNLLYQQDGTLKSRPYIDEPVFVDIAYNDNQKCFFTSLILDYCINIYEQLLMVLLTKEINSSTYIEFNNEMSNKNFEDIFNNMVTDIHILEFMVKYKSLTNFDQDSDDKAFYKFDNHKKFNYDIYFNDPLYQITFIPELRNNPFYNVNKKKWS